MKLFYFFISISALSIFFILTSANASIVNVPADQTTIQGGINAAGPGDTVLVASGTYVEQINFGGKSILVVSEDFLSKGRGSVQTTIIDANFSGSAVVFNSGEGNGSVLSGFTIQNGIGTEYEPGFRVGGGIACDGSSPTITNCIISGNSSDAGGGIACAFNCSPIIACCEVIGNTSTENGGGIMCYEYADAAISNCVIAGNSAGYIGGGIICTGIDRDKNSQVTITNCTIAENSADFEGGGIGIAENGVAYIRNCIVWNNTPDGIKEHDVGDQAIVNYSDVQEIWAGVGNQSSDPVFENPLANDYHLRASSICIDTGDPALIDACTPPGLGTSLSDMGAYGGPDNCCSIVNGSPIPGFSIVGGIILTIFLLATGWYFSRRHIMVDI
jgi:hypothetical protein